MSKKNIEILSIVTSDKIKLSDSGPFTIINTKDLSIRVSPLTKEEIESFLGVKKIEIRDDGGLSSEYREKESPSIDKLHFHKIVQSKYKLIISLLIDDNFNFQTYFEKIELIDFFLKIKLGCGCSYHKIVRDPIWQSSGVHIGDPNRLYENSMFREIILDRKFKNKCSSFWKILCSNKADKKNLIQELLNSAMRTENKGLSASLMVTILEGIIVQEKESEIGYRFSMRMAKRMGDYKYKKIFNDYYGARSTMFHSGKNVFKKLDINILQNETLKAMEDYFDEPNKFLPEYLDRLLIN